MALNTWWDRDDIQRYWMEVATTGSMGKLLIAPKFPGASWSYDLVGEVRPGDRVLHWQATTDGRELVGWSVATAAPEVVPEYTWQPRGTSGRALEGPRTTEGWMVTLGGLNRFERPLRAAQLQKLREPVLEVAAKLERTHGRPTYFPFYLYGGRELRAQQGYLVKFPAELFDVLPGLDAAVAGPATAPTKSVAAPPHASAEDEVVEDSATNKARAPRGSTTRIQDPVLRSAIENHAVDAAISYYVRRGGSGFVKLGKPYDIKFMHDGQERHVEVKGSSMTIETVELTINEVTHAEGFAASDLVVVDGITWSRRSDGSVATSGGRLRIWTDWTPAREDLAPRRFAYSLPGGSSGPERAV